MDPWRQTYLQETIAEFRKYQQWANDALAQLDSDQAFFQALRRSPATHWLPGASPVRNWRHTGKGPIHAFAPIRSISTFSGPPRVSCSRIPQGANPVANPVTVADSENRAFPSLEGLRLLASVAIVTWHYLHYLKLPAPRFHLAVDMFFVISGIVIAHVYAGRIASAALLATM